MASSYGSQTGFLAEFFTFDPGASQDWSISDIDWGSAPVATEVVPELALSGYDPFWQGGPEDRFAARVTADLVVETAGSYTFYLTSDDGSQLSLDGATVIDNDGLHGAERKHVTLTLEAGQHSLELLYFEWSGKQTLDLAWLGPDTGGDAVSLRSVVLPGGAATDPGTDGGTDPGAGPGTDGGTDPSGSSSAGPGFLAEFFTFDPGASQDWSISDIDWGSAPVATEVVPELALSGYDPFWQGGPEDRFAARVTADLVVETAGSYTFYLTSDDGSQLSLDGATVIDNDGLHGAERKHVTLTLEAGQHSLELLYFEWSGKQTLDLAWLGPDTGGDAVSLRSVVLPGGAATDPGTDGGTDPGAGPGTDGGTDPSGSSSAGPGFLAEFFTFDPGASQDWSISDIDWGSAPVATEVVPELALSGYDPFWQGGPEDRFAARVTADLVVETAGSYTFYLTSDDGSQLSLDGATVIDNDGLHGAERKHVTLTLEAGQHSLELLYFEWSGKQTLDLAWLGPDTGGDAVSLRSVVLPGGAATDPGTDGGTDPGTGPGTDGGTDPSGSSSAGPGFLAEFFTFDPGASQDWSISDIDWGSAPVATEVMPELALSGYDPFWQGGPEDRFAARVTADLVVETAGSYTFYLTSDDGSQLSLDGATVIDNDGLHGAERKHVTLTLEAGQHSLELLYFEWSGKQTLDLAWLGPDTGGDAVSLRSVVLPGGAATDPGTDGGTDPGTGTGTDGGTDPSGSSSAGPGFLAEFFTFDPGASQDWSISDIDWGSAPVATEVVPELALSGYDPFWQGGPEDRFAARVTADLVVETAGSYTFYLTSDDGSQLSLDGATVIDNDGLHGAERKHVTLTLEAGQHSLELLYFEWSGKQTLDLAWLGPDTGGDAVSLRSVVLPGGAATDPGTDGGTDPGAGTGTDGGSTSEPETGSGTDTGSDTDAGTGTTAPNLPERTSSEESGAGPDRLDPVEVSSDETMSVAGGRTTTLRLDTAKEIASVEITGQPAHGNASVNPDNSIALVLSGSDFSGRMSLDYQLRYADGSSEAVTQRFDVATSTQGAGWGLGQHYMLVEDANGDIVVETGDNHRKVYVTESAEGLTRGKIAAMEGVGNADITDDWLVAHAEYGGSEDMALATDAGLAVWDRLTGEDSPPGSHWLLFEAGYEYANLGPFVDSGSRGESALHPLHVTSWGEGAAPVIASGLAISKVPNENIVLSDLRFSGGLNVKDTTNLLLTDSEFVQGMINLQDSERVTLHDSSVSYAVEYDNNGEYWTGRGQGLYAKSTEGLLLEGSIFHHNGWEDGYLPDGSIEGGVSPNMLSHNVYLQWDMTDVTYRDNISSQASSIGAQFRGGAFVEDSLFTDHNVALNMLGGDYKGNGHVGNFTFFADNVVTSGAYKDAPGIGAQGWGMNNAGKETTWLDNIIAHLADPDDPEDLAAKVNTRHASTSDEPLFYDDTKVLNWLGADPERWKGNALDKNLDGVDISQAMQTTIQRFAAELTNGQTATIDGLMDYLLSLAETEFDDQISARDIVAYFQDGFGMSLDGPGAASHRFIPNDLAAGVRWDNRINWDSGETPGAGDNVDLGGNRVYFGTLTTDLRNLDLGPEGQLSVTSGRLEVTGTLEADGDWGRINIDGAGQFWTAGYADSELLEVAAEGGRFANTGDFTGPAAIHLGDNAQAILATDRGSMVLGEGSELRIEGSEVKAGFDGDRSTPAVLQMADGATLSFVADRDGFSALREFRSGAWDQSGSPVRSGVSLDGTLQIDLSDYRGGTGTHTLISVDALDGIFDDIRIFGLSGTFDARTVVDYQTDELLLQITSGRGRLTSETEGTAGALGDEARSLADALTAGEGDYDDGAANLRVISGEISDLLF